MKHFICNEYLAQVWIIIKNTMNSLKNSWKDTKKSKYEKKALDINPYEI